MMVDVFVLKVFMFQMHIHNTKINVDHVIQIVWLALMVLNITVQDVYKEGH
jgi:hypothetical protein